MMLPRILYAGDTTLQTAAAYLAGLLHRWGWPFQYVASDTPLNASQLEPRPAVLVLSDYPAAQVSADVQRLLADRVRQGMGIVMFGGWESFHGAGGNWDRTPLAAVLPVEIRDGDDRVNFDQPAMVCRVDDHPILCDLPWDSRPPCVGGLNRFSPRAESRLLLEAQAFSARLAGGEIRFAAEQRYPLLVTGSHAQGRTAALATDVAPHWVGGMVDWGRARVTARAPGAEAIEVGEDYARFFHQLLAWAAGGDERLATAEM